jgi:hypothetical protein
MARKTVTGWMDDLDGGQADERVQFSLDGKRYEIDLSKNHARALRDTFASYIVAARRSSAGRPRRAPARTRTSAERDQNQAIRQWARRRGMKVSTRGRMPADVIEAYQTS